MNNGNLWFGTAKERGYSMSGSFIGMLIASLSFKVKAFGDNIRHCVRF